MVSREGKELLEEGLQACSPNERVATADKTEILSLLRENEDSLGSISITGLWSESESEYEDSAWFTESCSAVLEPSKDEERDSVGRPIDLPEDFFTLSCPEIATDKESTCSTGEATYLDDEQQSSSERRNSNEQQSNSESRNSNEQQSNSKSRSSNWQQSSSERRNSNWQQSSSERRNSNWQQSSSERRNRNEQQSSSERRNRNEQQSSSESRNSNERQSSSESRNSNERQSSSESRNSNERQSNSESRNSNERQSSSERRRNSNEQQSSSERRNSNEQNSNQLQNSGEKISRNEQQNSNELHNNNEEQTDEPNSNCCAAFLDCYNINSRKIMDSRFIYIFQLFVILLSVSEIVMGIIFYGSCDPQPSPILVISILMAVSGLALVYNWFVKVRRNSRGENYWNFERNILTFFLAVFLFLFTLEIAFFTQTTPKTVQSTVEVRCIKVYYDYLYYMLFAIGGSLALAASLYLPDCCIYAFTYQAPVPSQANGHYQPL